MIKEVSIGFITLSTILVIFALIVCVYTLRNLVRETRLPGKRLFGMNCDGCRGKFRKNGKPLLRCYIKKPLVKFMIRTGIIQECLNLTPPNNNQ
jgi:hypothetical protein